MTTEASFYTGFLSILICQMARRDKDDKNKEIRRDKDGKKDKDKKILSLSFLKKRSEQVSISVCF